MAWTLLGYDTGGSPRELDFYYRNIFGSPAVQVARKSALTEGANHPPAGVYRIKILENSIAEIRVNDSRDWKNPLHGVTKAVVLDSDTENLNLVPGISVIFSALSQVNDVVEIGVGAVNPYLTTVYRGLCLGIITLGAQVRELLFALRNDYSNPQVLSRVRATNAIRVVNTQTGSRPLFAFRQTGILNPTADADTTGRSVTFDNLVPGSPATVDLLVDGELISLYDVTNEQAVTSQGIKADETTIYRFADGSVHQSGEFLLAADLQESDSAVIYVSDAGDMVQLATLVADWVVGSTGVVLTGSDCPVGVVDIGQEVFFRLRVNPPESADAVLNQRQFSLRVSSVSV